MASGGGAVDFFVSYTEADRRWALWVAEVLEQAGCSVRVQAWDSPAGANFVVWISEQMELAERTVALFSPRYFQAHWCTQEWTGALAGQRLVPLRVQECEPPEVVATIAYRDLFGLDEATARARLLEAVGLSEVARRSEGFPGTAGPGPEGRRVFPGGPPAVFQVPGRLPNFMGRVEVLGRVREALAAGPVAVTALHGLGGVGKSQVAIEFAHRHTNAYEVVWWVDAEQPDLIAEQLAELAGPLGLDSGEGDVAGRAAAVLGWMRRSDGWLVIFDNAENPDTVAPWLAGGPGDVLVTSRHQNWGAVSQPVALDVFDRPESIAFLSRRVPGIAEPVADEVAGELGDLPLGLEQAAAYIGSTGMSAGQYLDKFRARRDWLLGKGHDIAYGGTIDTAWSLALDGLRGSSPAAVELLEVCAQFSPEPIPLGWFRDHPDTLGDGPLGRVVSGEDPAVDLDDVVAAVLGYSLARREGDSVQLHRLVAAVIRAHQPPDTATETAATARAVLAAAKPPQRDDDPAGWPTWGQLMAHALAAPALHPDDPATDIGPAARDLLTSAGYVLFVRGDARAANAHIAPLHDQWRHQLGEDHPDTLNAAHTLAITRWALGDYEGARALDEDTLTRHRRTHGEDNPATLSSASNLAVRLAELGDHDGARALEEDTLARRRRTLGDNHPDTLTSANSLAIRLAELGDHDGARALRDEIAADE